LRTLVLGLGNPILTDDCAGIEVLQTLKEKVRDPDVDIIEASVGGLDLLDRIVGYDRLILIDSIQTGASPPGSILRLVPEDLGTTSHLSSPHDIGFKELIELGRRLSYDLPSEICIYAIEVRDTVTFGELPTTDVAKAVQRLGRLILEEQFQHI